MKNRTYIYTCLLSYLLILFTSCNKKIESNDNIEKSYSTINDNQNFDKPRRLDKLTELEFDDKIIDLGDFNSLDSIAIGKYYFKNTGENPLLIEYVNPDCSCTDFDFTKDTILPNEQGYIELKFNPKNKSGNQKLYAVVRANTKGKFYRLILKLNII